MKLNFLGTGGGRYATGEQDRRTGGIVVETQETQIHIDPGPGALVWNHEEIEEPLETEAVIVSHAHLDHANDAEAIIEMMTEAAKLPGNLFANETALNSYGDIEQCISNFHQELCLNVKTLEEGSSFEFKDVTIESQHMFHGDPKTAGLKIKGEKTIGFWTDTEFSEELLGFYEECDWLVIYCTRPKDRGVPSHTGISDVPKILEAVQPEKCLLTHFGKAMLDSDMEAQKEWLKEQTDVKITFAEDGMSFPGNRSLGDF
ncbi:MBL fold metallo-hydrolase [Candidatus Nanohalococcus occultus]|uniref:Metal-dependent hydrolase of the beta-lactamase superfamily n=1 Tax=Candidatus Nanohalococcus occultus TaxID=2978047 RepID=A0ABY8CEM3_9ARCH|nr:Metal-dependent hydrolase of the beta-lactamase superfamily [Candidatus Nanohaloarchaeota archaeon SVXNc]